MSFASLRKKLYLSFGFDPNSHENKNRGKETQRVEKEEKETSQPVVPEKSEIAELLLLSQNLIMFSKAYQNFALYMKKTIAGAQFEQNKSSEFEIDDLFNVFSSQLENSATVLSKTSKGVFDTLNTIRFDSLEGASNISCVSVSYIFALYEFFHQTIRSLDSVLLTTLRILSETNPKISTEVENYIKNYFLEQEELESAQNNASRNNETNVAKSQQQQQLQQQQQMQQRAAFNQNFIISQSLPNVNYLANRINVRTSNSGIAFAQNVPISNQTALNASSPYCTVAFPVSPKVHETELSATKPLNSYEQANIAPIAVFSPQTNGISTSTSFGVTTNDPNLLKSISSDEKFVHESIEVVTKESDEKGKKLIRELFKDSPSIDSSIFSPSSVELSAVMSLPMSAPELLDDFLGRSSNTISSTPIKSLPSKADYDDWLYALGAKNDVVVLLREIDKVLLWDTETVNQIKTAMSANKVSLNSIKRTISQLYSALFAEKPSIDEFEEKEKESEILFNSNFGNQPLEEKRLSQEQNEEMKILKESRLKASKKIYKIIITSYEEYKIAVNSEAQ